MKEGQMSRIRPRKWFLICAVLGFVFPSQIFAARIVSITTCESVEPSSMKAVGVRSRFTQDTREIHLLVQFEGLKAGSKVKGTWISVDAIKTPNYEIDSSESQFSKDGEGTAHFSLSRPNQGWPVGNYKVDLHLDGALLTSVPFAVAASPMAAPASSQSSPQSPSPKLVSLVSCEAVASPGLSPINVTDTFDATTPELHVLAKVEGAVPGTKLKGIWSVLGQPGGSDRKINATEAEFGQEGGDTVHFLVEKPEGGWPAGNYRFDLYINGKTAGNIAFSVRGGDPARPPFSLDLGPERRDPQRIWTIAVYLDGDNDLEPFALKDLKEMERGISEEGVECIVFLDRAGGEGQVVRIRKDIAGSAKSEVITTAGEVNMADPQVLHTFLASVLKAFPAQHHALILWDHGGGWAAHLIDEKAPGAPKGRDKMTLPRLREAVAGALKDTGRQRIDIIGFDMCLMAQLEVACELSGLAEIMLASQAVEPGDGWPYDQILPYFGKGTMGARRLAAQIVESYGKYYGERKERVATLSAVDLGETDKLVSSLSDFARKMSESVPGAWPEVSRSLYYSEGYADRTDIRRKSGVLASVDLMDVLNRLRLSTPNFPAQKEYQDIVAIMDKAIIAKHASPRHRLSHGLAVYAPVRGAQFDPDYLQIRMSKTCAWQGMLSALHKAQEQQLSPPRVTDIRVVDAQTGNPVKGGKPGGGFKVEATVEGENILWVQYMQAVRDDKRNGFALLEKGYVYDPEFYKKKEGAVADVVDLIMPEFKGNRNKVSKEFIGRHLKVTDGRHAARATIDASSLSDLQHAAVPVALKRQGAEQCFATLFFNAVTWTVANVVAELPQKDGTVAYRQVKLQPEDEVTLLFEFISDDGKAGYVAGETLKWGKGLELVIDTDEPSNLTVAMRAESIAGQSSFATTQIKLEALTKEEQSFVENARKVKLKDLVGTWQWHGLKDGQWNPIPPFTEIAPSPSNPEVLIAKIQNPGDSSWKVTPMAVLLDTRLMPTLRLISFDDEGRPVEAMNFTMLVSRWDQGAPRMILKYLVPKGWLLLWAKRQAPQGTATGPAPGPGMTVPPPVPSQVQPPSPSASLAGLWYGPDREVLKMGESTYELYEFNMLEDKGVYEIRGKQLITRSAITGEVERFSFSLSGQQLTLRDSGGQTFRFRRKQ